MDGRTKWLYGLRAAVVLLMLFLLALVIGKGTDACSLDIVKHDGATWCWEFWLNRYQTFVGALVAIAAALVTWIGIRRQAETSWASVQVQIRSTEAHRAREERVLVRTIEGEWVEHNSLVRLTKKEADRVMDEAGSVDRLGLRAQVQSYMAFASEFRRKWSNVEIEDAIVLAINAYAASLKPFAAATEVLAREAHIRAMAEYDEGYCDDHRKFEWQEVKRDTQSVWQMRWLVVESASAALDQVLANEMKRLTSIIVASADLSN